MSNTDEIVAFVALESSPRMMLVPDEDQPQIAEHIGNPCTKVWSGYFKYEPDEGVENMTIEVGADDNAYLQIDQFADTPVNVEPLPNDPNGGGTYRTNSHTFENAPAGFYHVIISYENVGGVAVNLSQLTVKVNGEDMVIGTLEEAQVNLLKEEDAQSLLAEYTRLDYDHKTAAQVWEYLGGRLKEEYDKEVAANNLKNYKNTCATRLSIALCRYGVTFNYIPAETELVGNVNKVDGIPVTKDSERIIIKARYLKNRLSAESMLGAAHFNSWSEYVQFGKRDTDILFRGCYDHVGLCTGANQAMGAGYDNNGNPINYQNEQYWLLYRDYYLEPESSAIKPTDVIDD